MKEVLFPGDIISVSDGFIKGYGTNIYENNILSSVYGTENHINKLVTVDSCFSFKYTPEVGDVVIGRVTQIVNKKWKIFTNSKYETTLSLSAVNLQALVQRRKLESDEIDMVKFFDLNDLIVCEVQKVSKSGNAALHTRNEKYRKLKNGLLLKIILFLLLPLKNRFWNKDGIEVIIGCNGFIWISSEFEDEAILKKITHIYKRFKALNDNYALIDAEKELAEINFE